MLFALEQMKKKRTSYAMEQKELFLHYLTLCHDDSNMLKSLIFFISSKFFQLVFLPAMSNGKCPCSPIMKQFYVQVVGDFLSELVVRANSKHKLGISYSFLVS